MNPAQETRLIERDNCVLVMSPISPDLLGALSKRFRKGVIDPGVAKLAGAQMAIGKPKDLDILRENLIAEQRAPHAARYANSNLSPEAIEWLLSGRQGTSSCAIFWKTTGVKPDYLRSGVDLETLDHPSDPDDLNRCILLLKAVPQCAAKFDLMRDASPEWAVLVDNWRELVTTFDDEAGIDWSKGKRATRTFDFMQALFASVDRTSSTRPSTL